MEAVYKGCIPEHGWRVELQLSLGCQPKFLLRIQRHSLNLWTLQVNYGKLSGLYLYSSKLLPKETFKKNGNNPTTISTCWYLELRFQGKDIPWHCGTSGFRHGGNIHPTCKNTHKIWTPRFLFQIAIVQMPFLCGFFRFWTDSVEAANATLPTQKGFAWGSNPSRFLPD